MLPIPLLVPLAGSLVGKVGKLFCGNKCKLPGRNLKCTQGFEAEMSKTAGNFQSGTWTGDQARANISAQLSGPYRPCFGELPGDQRAAMNSLASQVGQLISDAEYQVTLAAQSRATAAQSRATEAKSASVKKNTGAIAFLVVALSALGVGAGVYFARR